MEDGFAVPSLPVARSNTANTEDTHTLVATTLPTKRRAAPQGPTFVGVSSSEAELEDANKSATMPRASVATPSDMDTATDVVDDKEAELDDTPPNVELKYRVPHWSGSSPHPWRFDVIRSGTLIGSHDLSTSEHVLIGRVPICDIVLDHESISRQHAVIQHRSNGDVFLFDLGSTHRTKLRKKWIQPNVHVKLQTGDIVQFGASTRLYVLEGGPVLQDAELPSVKRLAAKQAAHAADMAMRLAAMKGRDGDDADAPLFQGSAEEAEAFLRRKGKGATSAKEQRAKDDDDFQLPERSYKMSFNDDDDGSDNVIYDARGKPIQPKRDRSGHHVGLGTTRAAERGSGVAEADEGEEAGEEEEEAYMGVMRHPNDSDSDDEPDAYLDRTSTASKKRRKKWTGRSTTKVETADTLTDKLLHVSNQRATLQSALESVREKVSRVRKEAQLKQMESQGDALDAFMTNVGTSLEEDKERKLVTQIDQLKVEEDRLQRLLSLAVGALDAQKMSVRTAVMDSSKPVVESAARLVRPSPTPIPASDTSHPVEASAPKKAAPSRREQKLSRLEQLKADMEAIKAVTPLRDRAPEPQANSDDDEEDIGDQLQQQQQQQQRRQHNEQRRQLLEAEAAAAASGATIVSMEDVPTLSLPAEGEEEQRKPLTKKEKKKQRRRKKSRRKQKQFDDQKEGAYVEWVPPSNQRGDGRTALNDKLGY